MSFILGPNGPSFPALLCLAQLDSTIRIWERLRWCNAQANPPIARERAMPRNRSKHEWKESAAVAGNGLLDRRAFLRGGAAMAAAITGYTVIKSAAGEPLADDPWSRTPGTGNTPYQQRSRYDA